VSQRIEQTALAGGFSLLIKGLPESGVKRVRQQEIVCPNQESVQLSGVGRASRKACLRSRSLGVERADTVACRRQPCPDFDGNTHVRTFYTTGTTGQTKGEYFTHRQLVLHTLATPAALAAQSACAG